VGVVIIFVDPATTSVGIVDDGAKPVPIGRRLSAM